MAGDFASRVFKWGSIWLADDGEKLVKSIISVYGDGFSTQILEFNRCFGHQVSQIHAQGFTPILLTDVKIDNKLIEFQHICTLFLLVPRGNLPRRQVVVGIPCISLEHIL